ncbi:hypothetical protein LCGC14_0259380 [marine sediment metagenome]|uniref:Uncharacterized protein n=1 Tax=marine sediment metagenome TaxID=412755 RepID=A0A0F9X7D0_9ZZZZ
MDVVVTVPKSFGLAHWVAEGDAAGEPESGEQFPGHDKEATDRSQVSPGRWGEHR